MSKNYPEKVTTIVFRKLFLNSLYYFKMCHKPSFALFYTAQCVREWETWMF